VTISLVIAIVCMVILTVMIRDRWDRPEVRSAEQAQHETTGSAGGKTGARLMPSDVKLSVEQRFSGLVPAAQPAHPD
jgi:hypothetical protein